MTERRVFPRSTCCVPGCPRWSRRFPGEWLCAAHWRMVRPILRRALNRVWRKQGDLMTFSQWTKRQYDEWQRLDRLHLKLWPRAVRSAVMRSAGL